MILLYAALALFGSIAPTLIYVSIAWLLDRYQKEPWWLLLLTFAWGAIPACVLAVFSELIVLAPIEMVLPGELDATPAMFVKAVLSVAIVAPIVEECLKAVPLFLLFFLFRKEFDGLMDGLLYGALAGFGFAMTENFFYIFSAGVEGGLGAGLFVLFLRTVVLGMMHALWTSMLGIGLTVSCFTRSHVTAVMAPIIGLCIGMTLHGLHNFSAVLSDSSENGLVSAFALFVMLASYGLGCIAWLTLTLLAGHLEGTWIREELHAEIASGVLSAEEARACGRFRIRTVICWNVLCEHGLGPARLLNQLFDKGAGLGIKKRRLKQCSVWGTSSEDDLAVIRAEIHSIRQQLRAFPAIKKYYL